MKISNVFRKYTGTIVASLAGILCLPVLAAPTGEFRYPANNHTFSGNLLFSASIEDPDGIGNLRLRFNNDSGRQITICNNCGNTESFTDAGINPRDYDLNIGSHEAQLVVIKNGNEQVLDSVRFTWSPPEISGISVVRSIGDIALSWSALNGYNLYNLYISSEANISPNNIDSLNDSITFRSIRGTSQSISGVDDELGLFGLITGTDTSGESAYSEVFRIEALDNQDPEVTSESFTLDEDGQVNGNLLTNDSDPEEQPLTAELSSQPFNGEVTLDSNGDFTYRPFSNFNGEDSFSYLVSDPQGGSQLGSVSLTVRPVNDAPVAASDAYQLAEDTVLNIATADGVLANDSDVDLDSLTATLENSAQNGVVNLNSDGSFNYQPTEHYFGSDSFTYSVSDTNGGSSTGTVTITVSPVNDIPVATDDNYQMNEDQTLVISSVAEGVLANDSDADFAGDERFSELTVTLLSSPDNGELNLQSDGTFQYTPASDFFGAVSFNYQVTDPQGASASAVVFIEVADQPESAIAQDDAYILDEDTTLSVQASDGVLANDSNVDSNDVSLTVLTSTESGQLTLNADGSFSYQPADNFNGSDSFSYRVSNTIGSDEAQVILTINAINDAPIVTDDTATTLENTAVTITPLDNDSDPDGDALSVAISSVSDGTAVVQENSIIFTPATDFIGDATVNYLASDNQGGETNGIITISVIAQNEPPVATDDEAQTDEDTPVTISPLSNDTDPDGDPLTLSILAVSSGSAELSSDNSIIFSPEADFNGLATISYQIADETGETDQAVINVTVSPVNDAPIAQDDEATVDESATITLSPLDNDSDVDGDELSITSVETSSGTATFTGNAITYTAPDAPGTDSIIYTISDGNNATATATINVTITNVQDAPVAADDAVTTDEDTSVVISPLDNDTDEDGDTLSVTIDSVTNGTAELESSTSIRYTPTADFFGTASIVYTASDESGNSDSATISITVNSVNDAPVANNDSASTDEDTAVTVSVLDNDSDAENESLSVTITSSGNGSAVVNGDNSITFTPDPDFNGSTTLEYTVSDSSGGSDSAELSIVVIAVNDAPIAINDSASVDQGESVVISPLDNDSDVDGDDLIITSATADDGNVVIASDEMSITYTATSSFSGTDTISYVISDGTDSDSGSVTVTVNDVNETPVASNDEYDVNSGETADLDVLSNDTDGDGDTLTITEASATQGTVSISTDATSLSYTAPSDTTTTDTVSYTVSDPSGATASATATINVTEQTFSGDFDSDGDGNSDVSASSDGTDYTVTFGDDVDAVYYEEDGSYVSVSANDDGSYELTIEGSSTSGKDAPKMGGIKMQANLDFVLPSSTNTVYYTIDGVEYSFTVSNLDQPNANVAFGPPTQLDTSFEGATSHDFYLRQATFSGPLRFGVENGEHYILAAGGTGMVRGADFDGDVTWQDNSGILTVNIDAAEEFEQQYNVYDLDNDSSDGIALNIITKAEADAYVTAYQTEFVTVNITDARQEFRFLRDNRIYIDAEIDVYYQYRIDSSLYPEITSANNGVVETTPSETQLRQLWNIDSLKLQKITFADISSGIATEIPRLSNNTFETFAADFCLFTETTTGSESGSGSCQFSSQSFTWTISNDVLNIDFGNDVTAAYRWLDDLIVENTFSIELTVGSGSNSEHYSKHVYWLTLTNIADSDISNLLTGHYFDSALSKSNPDARGTDNSINTSETDGFYFDASGLGKYLTSRNEFDGTSLIDTDRRWEVNSGTINIFSQSTLSSGNSFSYEYDQCIDNGDASCFIWQIQLWVPIVVSGNRIWVWEWLLVNDTGPDFNTSVNYEEHIKPRIQYYELNSLVPGAPNSISFNQEPIWQSIDFNTDINISVSNFNVLNNFADPESDPLAILDGAAEQGTLTINNDNSINYTPPTDFIGDIKYYLEVSDSINSVYASGTISVLSENFAPVAVDDSFAAFSGIQIALAPLDNDTDANNDLLTITSVTSDVGVVSIDSNNTQLDFTAPASFSGNATLTYFISDGRGGSDSATITVSVTQPSFSGSYDFNNSTVDDFTIASSASDFSVVFGEEVSAVYYEENGKIHTVSRNADGFFEFVYNAGDTNIAQLTYVINGVAYSFAPDDLSLTLPNLLYFGDTELINDFADQTEFLLITRQPTFNSALATGFENGKLYDLQSTGFGQYSSPTYSDSLTWDMDANGIVTVTFDNPVSETIYYNVYDLDDEVNNDGALGVITKAEADAYYAAYNDFYVPVNITTVAHELDAYALQAYFYEVNISFIQSFQIDSSTYPEITSANSGVLVTNGGDYQEMLDPSKFDFLSVQSADILGTLYLPIAIEDGAGNFMQFASDVCTFTETTTGSNDGSVSCSITGSSASWAIETDGSVSVDFGNSLTAVYRWLDHSDVENTLFIKAIDINGDVYSTLDYWLHPNPPSAADVNALIDGNYLEIGDNLSNRFNYDQDGFLNDSIGNGYYFDNSGLGKALSTSFDENNDVQVSDVDMQWQVDGSGNVSINELSNLSSGDTYTYLNSQCTNSNDQSCYIWQTRTWLPIALQNGRLWILDYEERDPDEGYYDNSDSLELSEYPKLRFYEVYSDIPGAPNSISFNQEPVFFSSGYSTPEDTNATFTLLNDVADPESDTLSILEAQVDSGSIVINGDYSVTFTPETSFVGSVQMKFRVDDGINQVEFFDYLTVTAANIAPVANDDTENAVGSHVYSFNVLDNDSDANSDLLTITNLSTSASGYSISSDNTQIEYNAPASITATDTVTYTISDGNGGADTATLTVNLVPNSDPTPANDSAGPVLSGNLITLTPLDNDSDPDSDSLTIFSASSSDGTTTVATDGLSIDFTPSISSGTASVDYTVVDDYGGSATASVSVSVTAVNNAPTDISVSSTSIDDNSTGTDVVVGSLSTTDADSGDAHTYSLVTAGTSANGTCSADTGNSSFNINGSDLRTNTALTAATYNVCVQSSDGTTTYEETLTITVSVGNTAPTGIAISSASIDDNATGTDVVVGSLSTTDADSGDAHTYSLVTAGTSANGTCSADTGNSSFNINGSDLRTNTALSSATYDVCVQSSDGTTTYQETLTITVSVGNSAPTGIAISSASIDDNATGTDVVVGSLSTTDVDSGDAHTYSLVTAGTSANGTCSADTGNSSFNINGSDLRTNTALTAATYNVCVQSNDGTTTYQETLTITVNVGNSTPTDILIDGVSSDTIADGDTGTNAIIGALTTTDVDGGDTHSYSLVNTGTSSNGTCSSDTDNGSFNIDGSDLRSNAALSAASYDVCVESNDGTTSFQTTLNVTVTSNTPVATADSYILLSASGMTASIDSTVGVLANDSDPNSDTLTVSIVTNPANDSAFTLNSDGSFSYQHDGSTVLTDSFVYQVSDGTYSSQETASLTIKRANFVPGICTTPEAYAQAGENFSQTIQVMDLDGDSQTFTVSGEPTWMTLATVDGNTATLSGTPSTSDLGTSSITFNSTDGYVTESLTFDLTVIDEFAVSNNTDIEFGGTTEVVYDAVIDNYGNIVVVGTTDGDFAVTRLLRDGSTDSNFNSGSVKTYDFGGTNDVAISVKVRPDNGLIIAGHTDATGASDNDYAVMVLKEDGTLDTSFSSDGVHTMDPSLGYDDFLAEVLLHDNGDITLIGQSFAGADYDITAVQLDGSGSVDAGFNSGSTLSISGINDLNPEAAIEDGEGNIYVVGHGSNGTDSDIFLTRFSVETGASNDFANAEANTPLKYLDDSGNEYGYDLAFDANGSVIVAGTKDDDFALYKFAITWDDTNTEWDVDVDTSFNSSTGKNIIDLNSSSTDFAYSMVSDKRGNYYIAGKQGTDTSIIRISADGTQDTGYGTSGVKTITLSSGVSNTPVIIRTDALGQLLIFDTEDAGSDAHVAITYDYILDPPTFGDCDYTSEYQATSNKTQDEVVDASVASDNDYFVAGWSLGQDDGNKDFVVVKTDSNGDFDALWGENGYARIDAGASTSITPYDVIGLADTEVVIAGVITGTDDLYLAKLNDKGELDSGFDTDGIRDLSGTVDLTPAQGIYVSSASAFLIAGQDSTNFYPWVYRFNDDGTDDLTFGAGTNVSTADTGVNYTVYSDANFSIYDMVVLSNGDIYLVGSYFDTYNKVALLKMDGDGLIDTTFGASGLVTFDQGSAHVGFKAATDGTSIYILGKDTSTLAVSVLKADASGNLDTSFDTDGIAEPSDYEISTSSSSSIQIDSNGAIWLQVSKSGTNESMVRLTSSGGFDTSFINAGNTQFSHDIDSWTAIAGFQLNSSNEALLYGTVSTDFALAGMSNIGEVNNTNQKVLFDLGYGEHATSIALDEYSGLFLAGYGRNTSDYDDDMAIAKFDNTGAGSNSFGSYGQTTSAIELFSPNGESTQFKDITLSANGHIFASGESILSGANADIYNAKVSADVASIDTTSYGSGLTDISGSSSDDLVGGHYQADDGYLYIVGSTDGKALVYRYDYSGNFDSSFNAATGTLELSTYSDSHFTAITPTSDGNLVAVGYYSNGGDIDALIVKFSPEGSLDSSFSSDGIYEFQVASTEERFYDVAIDGSGTIYAVGESNGDAIVIAMDNTATAATSWNSTGDLSYDVNSGSDDIATAIKVDAFGAIFVLVNSNNEFALLRFKPDGTLISDFGGTNGYSAINKMRDIAIDTLGNVFVTGSTQLDQQWQFFTVRYTNVVGPY